MRHVIGFGNPLHADDGVASAICCALGAAALAPDVRVFDAGTRTIDALALLSGCEEAILLDAARPALHPGRIECPDLNEIIVLSGLSTHGAGIGALLRALAALEQNLPRLRLITIEAERVTAFVPGLSRPVADAAARVTASLLRELGL